MGWSSASSAKRRSRDIKLTRSSGEMPAQTRLERIGDVAARAASLQPSDPNLRRGLHFGIAAVVALGVGLAIFAALGDLRDFDWRFRPAELAFAVTALAAAQLANAEIWRLLLRDLGPELGSRRARAIWCPAALGRYVPTSLLLPMLRVAMSERAGVPKRVCLASVAYETSLYLVAILLLGAYFVIDLPDLKGEPARYAVVALPLVGLVLLQPRIFHTIADWTFERLGRDPLPLSLAGRKVFEYVGLYVLTIILVGLSLYAVAQTVYPLAGSDLVVAVGAYAVGTALAIVAFMLPGGAIVREAGIALALAPVMPAAPAIAAAVLLRIIQIAVEVVLAVVTPILARDPRPG